MKKLSVLILATIFIFATTSCSDDDNETKKEEAFPTTGVVWKLQTVDVTLFTIEPSSEEDQNYEATECELRSTFQFFDDKTFTKKVYAENDTECVLDEQKGTWVDNDDREFTLTYTTGENTRQPTTLQITRIGLEERFTVSDQINGTIEETRYTYKF